MNRPSWAIGNPDARQCGTCGEWFLLGEPCMLVIRDQTVREPPEGCEVEKIKETWTPEQQWEADLDIACTNIEYSVEVIKTDVEQLRRGDKDLRFRTKDIRKHLQEIGGRVDQLQAARSRLEARLKRRRE